MIRLPKNSPCADCDNFNGVKQPHGNESVEYFYCDVYKKIPEEIASGKAECKKQIKMD